MFKKRLIKSIIPVTAWAYMLFVLSQASAAVDSSERSCLAPLLSLESSLIQQGFVNHSLSLERTPGIIQTARDFAVQESGIFQEILETKALLAALEQETKNPGSAILPKVEVMSDFHGEINLFLKYIADVILQKTGIKVVLDHTKFPQQSIQAQLSKQGVNFELLKSKKIKFHLLGDFSDRGIYGMKCFRAAEELKAAGIADVVTGNHDFLELMASMGYHLPIYKDYNFYGHKESEQLVFETHWNDPEIAKDRFGWWAKNLAEFVKQRKAMQQGFFKVSGTEDIKDAREELKAIYIRIQDQLAPEEKELWEELVGFFFGTTDVATGFNDIGMMSVQWWQERAEKVDLCLEQARKKAQFKGLSSREFAHEIVVWEDLKTYVDLALNMAQAQLNTAKQEGKWWHQVFNDINHQTYSSPEWYAMDWIFHKGWGTNVIAELNELELDQGISWDATNFMNNKNVQDFAAFSRKNFTLYLRDDYGFYYTHGWFPVNMSTGQIEFRYKGVLYRGKNIWQGLDAIQSDVRNETNSFADLQEAFSLVMSWYADKTVQIKPQHIKKYIAKFGIKAIQESIGARVWFTCHNPLNTLAPKGIMFKERQGDYAHISVDKGMSWKKFKDLGGYVEVDIQIKLRGFSNAEFTAIIDHPQTMTLKQEQDKQWTTIHIQENYPLVRKDFLRIAIKQLKEKLNLLEQQQKTARLETSFMSIKSSCQINSRAKLVEQAI
ncbi:MAG: hypothetical protein V1747_03920 [Candidatus Omnitrophota bacterium]